MWKEEQFGLYELLHVLQDLMDWDDFVEVFQKRWTDPHKAKKALHKIQQGQSIQRTSVKLYKNQFNEQLQLTSLDRTSPAILQAYMDGLKLAVKLYRYQD